MGWWRTRRGGVIGDGPANIIDEFDESCWKEPSQIPPEVRRRIDACYRQEFDRQPTEQELQELLDFCGELPGNDSGLDFGVNEDISDRGSAES